MGRFGVVREAALRSSSRPGLPVTRPTASTGGVSADSFISAAAAAAGSSTGATAGARVAAGIGAGGGPLLSSAQTVSPPGAVGRRVAVKSVLKSGGEWADNDAKGVRL